MSPKLMPVKKTGPVDMLGDADPGANVNSPLPPQNIKYPGCKF